MADAPRNPGKAGEPPSNGAVRSPGRRRLLQAGVSAAPIVMTVASRPVLAVGCDSPSGFTSLSQSHPGPGTCTGKGPISWTSHKANWPPPYNSGPDADPKFKVLFGSAVTGVPSFDPNKKLSDVMAHDTTGPWGLAQYIIAAYFNAFSGAYGTSTLLSTATVINIWSDYSKTGTYSPRAGATWSNLEIVAYLRSTMVSN
jgi:hypothetical protein